ncbi:helix-turn-helix domain-containing protein [Starkeya koreensis]|uniref:Helix-turn-helix domain-containing protein n=1 Tax=Ancylobacter koreensis TaxID=266121 RepID=A0ABT0DJ76_9HYPH|nr:helix-turn-helix domain-containing protein [Ancylobacter koreensis]MCK0207318.1 helix-turn-helix domain-containing protein [Ancylobacter koreensis]
MRQNIDERTGSPTRQPSFVESHVQNLRVAAHVTVLHEGDPARRIMEVVEGAVMLTKLLPDGRRQVVELLGPGDVFGLAHDEAYACSAETLTPATITTHERNALERDPALAARLLRRFEAQLCVMHSHALVLGRMSALERVAFFLLRLMPDGMVGGTLRLAMTRQEIADFLGLTLETVSRAFSELKRRGLVVLQRADEVRIQDRSSMRRLAGAA